MNRSTRPLLSRFRFCLALGLTLLAGFAPGRPDRGLVYTVGWVGNSLDGKSDWVLQDVDDIAVQPDGTLFTNVFWDEAGGNVQEWREGRLVAWAGHTHGWGYGGGAAVAANRRYLFIAQQVDSEGGGLRGSSWPTKGLTWPGISRRPRSDIRQGAPFPGGRGSEGDVLKESFLPVAEYAEGQPGAIRGLSADESELYVSCPFDNSIKIFDAETMAQTGSLSVDHPDRIALDHSGGLWILRRPEAVRGRWSAVRVDLATRRSGAALVFPPEVAPSSLCCDAGGRLLVADTGRANRIWLYASRAGVMEPAGAFGVSRGIFSPPAGQFGDRRYNRPTGVGVDAAGNITVASSGSTAGGSTVLESYSPNGQLRWRRVGLTFVDCPSATSAGDEVYTKEEHFVRGRGAGDVWSYRGYTVDPYRFPDDPRLHIPMATAFVRTVSGRRMLFCTDMTAEALAVFRFEPAGRSETAIPCGLFTRRHRSGPDMYPPGQPAQGGWAWIDANGDGKIQPAEIAQDPVSEPAQGYWVPDAAGTLWQTAGKEIRALPLASIDAHGVPHWEFGRARRLPLPPGLDEARRLRYLPDRDLLLVGGNRGDDHNQHWKPMGPVLKIYTGWRAGALKEVRSIVLPYQKGSSGHESAEPISFDAAGDYLFVAYTRGLKDEGITNAFVKVLRIRDLSVVGNLSAESRLGETGLLDLVESVSAVREPSGEYLVLLEDDYRSKAITFRWHPVE